MLRIIIILVIACSLLGGAGFFFYKKWRQAKEETAALIKFNGNTTKQVSYYMNKYNNQVAKNEALILSNKTFKELQQEGQLQQLKEFENLKKNLRNLELLVNSKLTINSSITAPVHVSKDSIYFKYTDLYKELIGTIKNDTIQIIDTTIVALSIVMLWNKKWFLGKRHYSIEAVSENKNVKFVSLETIIKRKTL